MLSSQTFPGRAHTPWRPGPLVCCGHCQEQFPLWSKHSDVCKNTCKTAGFCCVKADVWERARSSGGMGRAFPVTRAGRPVAAHRLHLSGGSGGIAAHVTSCFLFGFCFLNPAITSKTTWPSKPTSRFTPSFCDPLPTKTQACRRGSTSSRACWTSWLAAVAAPSRDPRQGRARPHAVGAFCTRGRACPFGASFS